MRFLWSAYTKIPRHVAVNISTRTCRGKFNSILRNIWKETEESIRNYLLFFAGSNGFIYFLKIFPTSMGVELFSISYVLPVEGLRECP